MVRDLAKENGAAGERQGSKKGYQKSGDAKKRAERKLVPAGDGPTNRSNAAEPHFAGALRQGFFPSGSEKESDGRKADDGSEERAEKDGKKRAAEAKVCANHEHHLDVAKTHAV